MSMTRRRLGAAAAGLAGIAASPLAAQQPYPVRAIRLVIPFPPSGGTDAVGRELAQLLGAELGQAVVVTNHPGGGTALGSDLVAKAPPDGYTLLLTSSALVINAALMKGLLYDVAQGFAPIGRICHGPAVIVTRPDSPLRGVEDILRAARADPGLLTYGSSGNGSASHLAAELFKLAAGVALTHRPYRGAGAAYTDLLGGRLDMVFGTAASVASMVRDNLVRAVAVTSATRSPAFAEVPAVAETLPGYEAEIWFALFAPGGTPEPVVARLNEALRRAAATPAYQARLTRDGLAVQVTSPAEMARFLRSEELRWRRVVTKGRITAS